MSHLLNDVRFGLRLLWKTPAFTLAAIAALALGIAANTAIFSIVYATLIAPLPYREADQLVMVWTRLEGNRNMVSAGDYVDWVRDGTVFQGLHAWAGRGVSLSEGERPEQVQASVMTPGLYTTVGNTFALGRDFLPEEAEVGRHQVAILSHRFWVDRFGGDPAVLGRAIRIDGAPHTVVGVLAGGLADRGQGRITLPLALRPEQIDHGAQWLLVLGRLKPGLTMEQASARMALVAGRIAAAHPESNAGRGVSVEPLKNNFLSEGTVRGLWMLMGAVGFVLLIACANVANLLLARGTARRREVAVRASLGARPRRLFAQFLTESLLLAAIGGGLGVLLANVLLDVIMAAMPPYTLPLEADVRLHAPVLAFTVLASALTGVLFGCAPAWQASRPDLESALKEEGRAALGGGRHRARRALVVVEFALALTLLAGGGLSIHGLLRLMTTDLGFRTDHLLTFSLPVPPGRLEGGERIEAFYTHLLERVRALPGVETAAVTTGLPGRGTNFGMSFDLSERPEGAPRTPSGAGFNMVSPSYFATLGIVMGRGRAFDETDRAGAPRVAIVNEAFVRENLRGIDPLRQRLYIQQIVPGVERLGSRVPWQVVGVYRGVKNGGPTGEFPEIAVPFAQSPWPSATVVVRTTGEPRGVVNAIAAVLRSLDPDLPMADVRTVEEIVTDSLAGARFGALLLGSFAGVALVLAALGIYGVMSFAVAQRTHEFGLKMALGADRGRLLRDVLREGLSTSLWGVALGSLGGYAVGRLMRGTWSAIEAAIDPLSLAIVVAALVGAALLACYVPARRAASVDPMTALRQD
jgi:putative ABC transport system permease protein